MWGPDPQFSAGWSNRAIKNNQAEVEAEETHAAEDVEAARARAATPRPLTRLGRIRKFLRLSR
jgi:hypothetical protein